ncbi:hypothetical protein ACVWZK_008084 [Bradyrhizobium sp. GM0.4]
MNSPELRRSPAASTETTRTPSRVSTSSEANAVAMTGRACAPIVAPTTGLGSTRMMRRLPVMPARASLSGISAATSMPVKPAPTTTIVERPGAGTLRPSEVR